MALNYKSTQEADGTFTIHDVQVLQLGTWRGSTKGEDGKPAPIEVEFGEEEATALLAADTEVRSNGHIRPKLKSRHRDVQSGLDGDIVGHLSPFKRVGDKFLSTIKGIPEAVFREIEAGRAGALSPDIVPAWTNRVSGAVHKLFMRAVSFTGGAIPAMQGLLPFATVEFEAGDLDREIQLETLLSETQGAAGGEPAGSVSFGDRPSEPKGETPKPQEVEMAEDTGAQALRDKELAFEAKDKEWQEKQAEERKALRKERLSAAWDGIVGVTATPAEEAAFMAVGEDLASDESVKAHIDGFKARPKIEAKKTAPTGSNPQEEEKDERSFEDKIFAQAVQMVDVDRTAANIPQAMRMLEADFTEAEQTEYAGYYTANFPVERVIE